MVRLRERLRPPQGSGRSFARELGPGSLASEQEPITRLLFERLDEGVAAEVESRIAGSREIEALGLDMRDPGVRRLLVLCLGMWFGVPSVAEQTGLVPAQPPEDVHAMARGPLSAAGGLYEANLLADALLSAGLQIEDVQRGLDFGCSSGRVVRVLEAAYPDARWLGCDPNQRAVTWASEHLPRIEFFVNGNEPPLPIADGSLDLAFAISIWSHFEPMLGLRWFEEMYRVLRPGGCLMVTTHGLTSVAYFATNGLRSPEQSAELERALYSRGWWYAAEFGEGGDWGVIDSAWGTAFVSPEWLLAELCPQWRVLEFAPGRNALNQDVYVLARA